VEYAIRFAESAEEHLQWLTARQQTILLDAIEIQLRHEPFKETRNRKPLRPNLIASWELRVGNLRVLYEIDEEETGTVNVTAIGIKNGNRLLIAGEEIDL